MEQRNAFFRALDGIDLGPYRAVPFWSWNDKLEPEELRRQVRQMKQAGMGGFFMHARGGLETEYLGEDWFRAVESSADEAQKQGLYAWCYDENGWPSGFAGGKLLENEENLVHYLRYERKDAFDAEAFAVYTVENGKLRRVMGQEAGVTAYDCIYDCRNGSTVDILNPDITDAFLRLTHAEYEKRFGERFSTEIAGFFTDEPQYFRPATAYSPMMLSAYANRYGQELLDLLGSLFVDCEQAYGFRFRYWRLMNELYTENFIGRIQRWCHDHGCRVTGHTVQENTLHGQMWGCAGVMPFYEYEDIPGMDWLGKPLETEMAPRQVSSVSQQLGKKQVMTETYACAGWDVTPKELRRVAEYQYVHGVNFMCQHLFPYSIRGQRKRDYPAFYSEHNPWTVEQKTFNDYFTKLGYLLANSREHARVLLIHPMHNVYLTYDRFRDGESVRWVGELWEELIERFGAHGIGHHYGDERLMEKYGEAIDGRLRIGLCEYDYVVVPSCETLDASTVRLLKAYLAQGGKLWMAGKTPTRVDGELADLTFLKSNTSFEAIESAEANFKTPMEEVRCSLRTSQNGDFLYVVNLSETRTEDISLRLPFAGAVAADLLEEKTEPLAFERNESGITANLRLEPGHSLLVLQDDAAQPKKETAAAPEPVSLLQTMEILESPENALTLDLAALSYDGVTYTAFMPVPAIAERLLRERTNREIWVKYAFTVEECPEWLQAEVETLQDTQLYFNGTEIRTALPGTLDRSFARVELTDLVHTGQNELVLHTNYHQSESTYDVYNGYYFGHGEVTEALMNCICYDSNIEAVYLFGAFCVQAKKVETVENGYLLAEGFSLVAPVQRVLPGNITQQGYFFFHGSMRLKTVITVADPNKKLHLNGRVQLARVKVNGMDAGTMLLTETLDLSKYLHPGENTLELELMASNRNLFGPHHSAEYVEVPWVDPMQFFFCGTWQDGHSDCYRESFSLIPFGLETLELL